MENLISDAELFRVNKVLYNFQRHKSKEVLVDGGILGDFPRAAFHYGSWDVQRKAKLVPSVLSYSSPGARKWVE